ncbi:hypothetical protein P3T73_11020 [Kiritimatiellota bacterium B12222]|nr:hypothetical protein P3T73_11020 [Kiritimatiellota bacterium B12222]
MKIRTSTLCLSLLLGLTATAFSFAEAPAQEDPSKVKSYLFVQNAESGAFKDGRLSFNGTAPVIFFSDRPYRVSGHTALSTFIGTWTSGDDSFAKNPPNAVLSILGNEVESYVVVLSDPQLNDTGVSYKVEVEEGTIPASFQQASLFIDNEAWAAVGGVVVGRAAARRSQEREAAAYSAGQESVE